MTMRPQAFLLLGSFMFLAACVARPDTPPTVADAKLSTAEINPGDSLDISFTLRTEEYGRVERVYLRGLPKNSVTAGTRTELKVPDGPVTEYNETITLQKPAADGLYQLELVIDYSNVLFTAPLGALEVNDIPSEITFSQFVPGSHIAEDCWAPTRLLKLQYTVHDDNGAADFVSPVMVAKDDGYEDLVFFPHWTEVSWQEKTKGIVLNRPSDENAEEELVVNDVRINCAMPSKSLYDYKIVGQNVTSPGGMPAIVESASFKYYVE